MLTNYQNFDTILPTVANRLPKNYIIVIRYSIKILFVLTKKKYNEVLYALF